MSIWLVIPGVASLVFAYYLGRANERFAQSELDLAEVLRLQELLAGEGRGEWEHDMRALKAALATAQERVATLEAELEWSIR